MKYSDFFLKHEAGSITYLGDVLTEEYLSDKKPLNAILGVDMDGNLVYADIEKWPHAIVAGASGIGKSTLMHTILTSLMLKNKKDDLSLLFICPRPHETEAYQGIPCLFRDVITDPLMVVSALKDLNHEMERRFDRMLEEKARNIRELNQKAEEDPFAERLPRILLVIDEFQDVIKDGGEELRNVLLRLVQKGRAAGIHVILFTNKTDSVTLFGSLKANMPVRISFRVGNIQKSREILDLGGAELLAERGEMILKEEGCMKHLHTVVTPYAEICAFTKYLRKSMKRECAQRDVTPESRELIRKVAEFSVDRNSCTIHEIQESFGLGFNRTSRIITLLEDYGIVSKRCGNDPRRILVGKEKLSEILSSIPEDEPEEEVIPEILPSDRELFCNVAKWCIENNQCSINSIQVQFGIGFNHASDFVAVMEDMKIVSKREGRNPRKVLVSPDELNKLLGK